MLNLGSEIIKITPGLVCQTLGIPMRKLQLEEKKKPSLSDPVVAEFRQQFQGINGIPTVKTITNLVKCSGDSGRLFKINFLVMFNAIMAQMSQWSTTNMSFLTSFKQRANFKSFDWCSYIITCLNRTKDKWNGKQHYNGPAKFLTECVKLIRRKTFELDEFVREVEVQIKECVKTCKGSDEILEPINEWKSRLSKYNKQDQNQSSNEAEGDSLEGMLIVVCTGYIVLVILYWFVLQKIVSLYLEKESSALHKKIVNLKPKKLEMPWQTEKNFVDCGIFAMRHMETYMAKEMKECKEDCGILEESSGKQHD
ncbi:hypothetical protein R6Q57_010999 [Mikania cordata]